MDNNNWISINTDPEMGKMILLYFDDAKVYSIGYYNGPDHWVDEKRELFWCIPSHWQNLPSPPTRWVSIYGFIEGADYRCNGVWVKWTRNYNGQEGFLPIFPYEDCGAGKGKLYSTKDKVFTYEENIWDSHKLCIQAVRFPPN